MDSKKDIDDKIVKLESERDGFLSTYRTLMAVWETKGLQVAKQNASKALEEAGGRNLQIEDLRKQRDQL